MHESLSFLLHIQIGICNLHAEDLFSIHHSILPQTEGFALLSNDIVVGNGLQMLQLTTISQIDIVPTEIVIIKESDGAGKKIQETLDRE